jgi:hypothetical protein
VHTRASGLRLILFSKDIGAFRSKVLEDFPHYVTQINCLTGAIISETYIRNILRRLYLTTIRSSTGAPPRLHLLEGAGWTEGAADILGGRPREAAPAGYTGPRPVCGGEVEGPHEGGEGRMKAARAA